MKEKPSASDEILRAGHRDRLRARLVADPSALTDAEILELALGHVYLRRDNNMLAKRLLHEKGSLGAVLTASAAELELVDGCGTAAAKFFLLIRELQSRCIFEKAKDNGPATLADAAELGKIRLGSCRKEEFWALLLDKQNKILTFMKMRQGSIDHVFIEPLEVVELMIRFHASSLVLMHNHPGGSLEPSDDDLEITRKIASSLDSLGLHLHDHLIITAQACRSIILNKLL